MLRVETYKLKLYHFKKCFRAVHDFSFFRTNAFILNKIIFQKYTLCFPVIKLSIYVRLNYA